MKKSKFPLNYKQSMVVVAIIGTSLILMGGLSSLSILKIEEKLFSQISSAMLFAAIFIFFIGRKQHSPKDNNKSDTDKK